MFTLLKNFSETMIYIIVIMLITAILLPLAFIFCPSNNATEHTKYHNYKPLRIVTRPNSNGNIQQLTGNHLFSQFLLVGEGVRKVDSIFIYVPDEISKYKIASAFPLKKIQNSPPVRILFGSNPNFSRKDTVLLAQIMSYKLEPDKDSSSITLKAKVNGNWLHNTMYYKW